MLFPKVIIKAFPVVVNKCIKDGIYFTTCTTFCYNPNKLTKIHISCLFLETFRKGKHNSNTNNKTLTIFRLKNTKAIFKPSETFSQTRWINCPHNIQNTLYVPKNALKRHLTTFYSIIHTQKHPFYSFFCSYVCACACI